jgi:hypothetical protein
VKLELRKENQKMWDDFIEETYPLVREFEFSNIPADPGRFVVMVEPREHPHMEYVLRNVMYFLDDGWGLQIFVGRKNRAFVENIVNGWGSVHIYQIETDDLTALEYNQLKKMTGFWEMVKGEQVLWIEPDCLLCHGKIDMFLEYDYVGAPWNDRLGLSAELCVGNGGLSLRKKKAMLEISSTCNTDPSIFPQEDVFYSINMHMQRDRYNLPGKEIAKQFSVESVYFERPLGLHKSWKYLPNEQLFSLLKSIEYNL